MEKFTRVCGVAAPFMAADVNTDNIMPSTYNRDNPDNLGPGLFYNWRYLGPGVENPEFFLNLPRYRGAKILVAGPNFGCGSSRENAVWGLTAYGVRCVIASSYGDIFRNNASKQGLVIVTLSVDECTNLSQILHSAPHIELTIDIERGLVEAPEANFTAAFNLDPVTRERLLNGWDDIGLTLRYEEDITTHERQLGRAPLDILRQHLA